jgi:hypothetical protein
MASSPNQSRKSIAASRTSGFDGWRFDGAMPPPEVA